MNNKKEQEREELHKTIWKIANELRGSVDGWDFKQYVLGLLFYRFISENIEHYVNDNQRKAGISNFTKWLATYFAGTGIRCNAIAPGFLVSAQNKSLLFNEDGTPKPRSNKILNGTPTGRFVDADELLGATLFLCDDRAASAITGVVLPVDAGFAAYSGV